MNYIIFPTVADAIEGAAILSTGETGVKFLRSDGDGTCSWQAIAGGGDALTASPLSQFAATTSSQLAGVISDETGTGPLVFANSPTLVSPSLGTPASGVLTNCTGLPAGSVTGLSTVATSGDYDDLSNKPSIPATVDELTDLDTTVTGADLNAIKTKVDGLAAVATSGEGTAILSTGETGVKFLRSDGDGTCSWQEITGGGGGGGNHALTTSPLSQFAATTSAQLAGVISDETGTGALVFANSPTLITPALGTPASGVLTNCTGLPAGSVVGLATVATSGDYDDLTNKPIPPVQIPALAGNPTSSNGATVTSSEGEASGMSFPDTGDTSVVYSVLVPSGSAGTFSVELRGDSSATASASEEWAVSIEAKQDDEASYGTAVAAEVTITAASTPHSITSGTITPSGSPTAGDIVYIKIKRDVSEESTSSDGDVLLREIIVTFD